MSEKLLDFLLEIGTEEIPDWMIPGALKHLQQAGILGVAVTVQATARRLVVKASGLAGRQADTEDLISGPPKSAGAGAAQGFAKKNGVSVEQLETISTPKGDYFGFRKKTPGRPTIDLLAEAIPGLVLGIPWPKTMYWTGKSGPRFIRPIRWIVALLGNELGNETGDQVIPFEIAGVRSGSITRGHRVLGSGSIPVTIATYEAGLKKNFVILHANERRHKIETEATALGAKIDGSLLETLTFITEYPTAIRGDFDPGYLELPAEVLTTVMRHHQKYFAVEDEFASPVLEADGTRRHQLAPYFVAVMNTSGDPEGLIKHGNERVLRARFNDARFFWNVDQQKTLAARVDDLAHVTFQAKLGSYLDKTTRVVALVQEFGGNADAQRAALLAKCDLTTEMVKEFTDLQGIVGGLYAKAQGEPEAVSRAIYEHYKPLSMEDSIPSTVEGRIVALADKLDTLRECFKIGMIPSGSKDPFALRRAAQGIVKILAEAGLAFPLDRLAEGELRAFLLDRITYYFREVRGFKYDEVNAVLASGCGALANVEARLTALAEVRPTGDFDALAVSFKRVNNILRQAEYKGSDFDFLDTGLLEDGPERELYDALMDVFGRLRRYQDRGDYRDALLEIASLRPKVDRYFDSVRVNTEDPRVRRNRLHFLWVFRRDFSTIADFSEIVTAGDQK